MGDWYLKETFLPNKLESGNRVVPAFTDLSARVGFHINHAEDFTTCNLLIEDVDYTATHFVMKRKVNELKCPDICKCIESDITFFFS